MFAMILMILIINNENILWYKKKGCRRAKMVNFNGSVLIFKKTKVKPLLLHPLPLSVHKNVILNEVWNVSITSTTVQKTTLVL